MAAEIPGVFESSLQDFVKKSKVLVVGAGGIGCEILKNLVLTGFSDIEIIDLDTIDVSNLNRQFLFQKQHVGKSKAVVARESALKFNPSVSIKAYHASIISPDFGVSFFKQFQVVLNALDNRAARNHVNRMCLAADIPLLESGTAGYEGQVELIKKGMTKCYECDLKTASKTYPGCTIRNTPSEPIHCIVWAKHLFNQLFGEDDPDEDVSPDTADPEASGKAGDTALNTEANDTGNVIRVSTRTWAQSCNYDPQKLFDKLFHDDIKYLLSMSNLWKTRRPPTPLVSTELPDAAAGSSKEEDSGLKDQRCWSIAECYTVFANSCKQLREQFALLKEGDHLVWDKDDKYAMDFVAACANIRAHIFGITQNSRFQIKSMAGNIIPAIATTNAVIAGLVVLHALRILENKLETCVPVYLRLKPNHKGHVIVPEKVFESPNPKCYVCSAKREVIVKIDIERMTVKQFEEIVLKKALNMHAPDVTLDGQGVVLISSEEGETTSNNAKTLKELGLQDGSVIVADDFLQDYELRISIVHKAYVKDQPEYEVIAAAEDLVPKPIQEEEKKNGSKNEDDNVMQVDLENETNDVRKRKSDSDEIPTKKAKVDNQDNGYADDIIVL
ncbi:unnamed protein product [Bemisia tabaci]|uniref:SUMO-activating enzyme subunit n=1 Tax=Bemisia tabaci TaxID=7038 RepID=A0A9P0F4I4_BEMTA|nr:unnamed protein product [Bemisia tabaci]